MYVWAPTEVKEGVPSPKGGIIGSYELPMWAGCWGPNSGTLQEGRALLTAEPSLRP